MDRRKTVLSGLALACALATGCVTTRPQEASNHQARTIVAMGDMLSAGAFERDAPPEKQAACKHEAQLAYLEAMKIDRNHLPAYLGLARLQKAGGDHVAALGTYQQALQLEERNAGLWHEVGMMQCKMRQWDAGTASLRKAAEYDPNNATFRNALGYSLVMAGKAEEGFRAMASAGGEAKAHLSMAKLLAHQGQADQARVHLAEASRLDPALPGLPKPAAEEAPRSEVVRTSYVAAPPAAPSAPPTIIQAGVVQVNVKDAPKAIDVPPLPVLSIRAGGAK